MAGPAGANRTIYLRARATSIPRMRQRRGILKSATRLGSAGVIQSDAGPIISHDLLILSKEAPMSANDRDQVLCERLNRHPRLRARVESLLEVVEDAAGECEKADAAERRVIEDLRQMGHDALTAWAERGVEKRTAAAQAVPNWRPGGKKTSMGTPPSDGSRCSNRS